MEKNVSHRNQYRDDAGRSRGVVKQVDRRGGERRTVAVHSSPIARQQPIVHAASRVVDDAVRTFGRATHRARPRCGGFSASRLLWIDGVLAATSHLTRPSGPLPRLYHAPTRPRQCLVPRQPLVTGAPDCTHTPVGRSGGLSVSWRDVDLLVETDITRWWWGQSSSHSCDTISARRPTRRDYWTNSNGCTVANHRNTRGTRSAPEVGAVQLTRCSVIIQLSTLVRRRSDTSEHR